MEKYTQNIEVVCLVLCFGLMPPIDSQEAFLPIANIDLANAGTNGFCKSSDTKKTSIEGSLRKEVRENKERETEVEQRKPKRGCGGLRAGGHLNTS